MPSRVEPSRVEQWKLLLEGAVAFVKGSGQKISFPSSEALRDVGRADPPDLEEPFQRGMDAYSRLDIEIPEHGVLAQAATSLYTAYENPPEKVRLAIVNLLRLSGAYSAACLYAYESIEASIVPKLLLQHMPLIDREGYLNLLHLQLPCWQPEAIIGALVCQCRALYREPEMKSALLWELAYSNEEIERLPRHLCTAICAFLHANLRAGKPAGQADALDEFVNSHDDHEIIQKLLPEYGPRPEPGLWKKNPWQDHPAWLERKKTFERLYAGRVQNGYVIYSPGDAAHYLWNAGPMTLYNLTEEGISRVRKPLREKDDVPLFLAAKYIDYEGRLELQRFSHPKLKDLEEQINRLKPLESVPEYKKTYRLLDKCMQMEDILTQAEHYEDFVGSITDRYNLFNKYTAYRRYDQEKAMEIMNSMLDKHENECTSKMLIGFFNYLLRIGNYQGAKGFLAKYKDRLGNFYYEKGQAQLIERLEKNVKNGGIPFASTADKEWTPVLLQEKYGRFLLYFFEKGLQSVSDDGLNLDSMDEEALVQEAIRLENQGRYYANTHNKAAEYLLGAGAVLYKRQNLFGRLDMEETMLEYMIYAFYRLSCYETIRQGGNSDVRRSYLTHALWLGKRLNERYKDNRLKATLEDALKQYFKRTKGHDDDSLAEAIEYMEQKSSVSNNEFGNRIIRLAIYYPDILSSSKIPFYKQKILQRLTAYVQPISWDVREPMTDAEVIDVMRSYRDSVVRAFNACPLICRTERDRDQTLPEYLEWVCSEIRSVKKTSLYKVCSEWDKSCIRSFEKLYNQAGKAVEADDFSLLRRCRDDCASLLAELNCKPCALAFELTYLWILTLQTDLNHCCEEVAAAIRSELKAAALFVQKDFCGGGVYSVYLRMDCVGGTSAITDISAEVIGSGSVAAGQRQPLCPYISRDGSDYCFIDVTPLPMSEGQQELSFHGKFYYTIERTGEVRSAEMEFSLPLQDLELTEPYEQMYNPSSALNENHAMAKYTFYGRDLLIKQICQIFWDFPNSIVMLYGQRRVGKTSIANYVAANMRRGEKKFLVVNCGNSNIQVYKDKEDVTDRVVQEFYSSVLQKLAFAIEEDQERGACLQNEAARMKAFAFAEDGQSKAAVTPVQFQRMILELHSAFEREPLWRGTRVLLWFDEFQQYYLYILKGVLQPEFVGFIKAFTEEYGFSLLLVGCEPMIPFIRDKRFGNTFSATTQKYVGYLSEQYAKDLICEPIQKKSGRKNPFQYVVDEIFQLSAGSPYFIQLICKNLIDELNDQKKVFASKQMIVESLHKRGQVSLDKFNCLYDSLDSREEAASPDDNIAVLSQIAFCQGSRRSGTRSDIIKALDGKTTAPPDKIITELISRGIVEELQDGLHLVVRLYEAWIWENRFELGYHDLQSGA